MKLIVGLGNPGEKYEGTRHNLGFMVVDHVLKDYPSTSVAWSSNEKLKSEVALFDWQPKHGDSERVILAKPKTYMNNSGLAVSLLAGFYKVSPEDIWIINDELDLPLGTLRIRFGGAAAGHHGVESVIEKLGTDKFWRFRLGIGAFQQHEGKQTFDHADEFVLGTFGSGEQGKARDILKHAGDAVQYALEHGLEATMNKFNTK